MKVIILFDCHHVAQEFYIQIFVYLNTLMENSIISVQKTASALRALGHSTRIEIIRLLAAHRDEKFSVTDIQEKLGLKQVETSRHLILMKNASLLDCRREGTKFYYFINRNDVFVKNIASLLCSDI